MRARNIAGLWGRDALRPMLDPSSIALVGASPRPGSFGDRTRRNLSSFDGRLYLVNPRYTEIDGLPCYPGISSLPEVPDCAVLVVGQEAVQPLVAECVTTGVGGVIVYAAGYSETGEPTRVAMQDTLVGLVAGTGTRLLGPNCMGVTNYRSGARITFGRMPERRALRDVNLGIVTQSGALSMSLAQSIERGVSVSHVFTTGNSSDVTLSDLVGYLALEPSCHGIVAVFEGLREIAPLLHSARLAREAGKPLVVYKLATGERGAAAALSHTGSMAGSLALYEAALESLGAVLVHDIAAAIETAQFLAKAGRPRGAGPISVVTSGGAGIIIADNAEAQGVSMHAPTGQTLNVLRENLPPFGSIGNPTDLTAQTMADDTPVRRIAEAVMADPAYSAAVLPYTFADDMAMQRLEIWKAEAARNGKMICSLWASQWLEGPGAAEGEAHPNVAVFRSAANLFRTLAKWQAREAVLVPETSQRLVSGAQREVASRLLAEHVSASLTEREAKQVLAVYGIPVVEDRFATTGDQAASFAEELGFPVVLKIESPDIAHKTEAGGVQLNLKDPDAVRVAFDEILKHARLYDPRAELRGVLVQPMVPTGLELMVGARVDPQFGPTVMVSLGGVLVELLADSAVALAPVGLQAAERMIASLRGHRLLDGFRGGAAVDRRRIAEIICRLSEFITDHAKTVSEVEINPLICVGERALAVDGLVTLAGAKA